MGERFVLAIGVRRSGRLPRLDGAIADARAFSEWASSAAQNYNVKLVTDESGAVTIDRLKTQVDEILKEDVSRLLIFYSGHGICCQTGDYWLLSNCDHDSDEAVNLSLSIRNARRFPIGQIAVFSDACRTSLNSVALVGGRSIFPSGPRIAIVTSPYDEFLSTNIGDVSQEVVGEDQSKAYGVFSRCLLKALQGLEPNAAVSRERRKVICSVALANWLEKAVPLESGSIPGGSVQYPSITPSWRPPDDEYAEWSSVTEAANVSDSVSQTGSRVLSYTAGVDVLNHDRRSKPGAEAEARVAEAKAYRLDLIAERSQMFQAQRGRESFETHQGLTVVGAKITAIAVPQGARIDLFEEGGLWHIRGYGGPLSVALRTSRGIWIAATLLPDFIGTLVFGKEGVESLNYAPPRSSPERETNLRSEQIVAEWNALLSVNRSASPIELEVFADQVREVKHINPAFGVLAAYAYDRIGRGDQVASIAWHFATRNFFIPFDVMSLLSAYGDPALLIRNHGWVPDNPIVAGGFPMITQGWALLDPESGARGELLRLRSGLKNSVWTSFDAKAGRIFANMIVRGTV
jgi:hypothetical protein